MRSQQNRSKLDFRLHHQRSPLRTKHRGPELQRVLRAPPAVRGLRAYRAGQVADLGPHPPPPSPLHATLCSSLTLPWMQETSPRELWLLCIQLSSSVKYKVNLGSLYQKCYIASICTFPKSSPQSWASRALGHSPELKWILWCGSGILFL